MLAEHAGIRDQDRLEKDVRLHLLLAGIVGGDPPGPNLVFKGGTCLIKCYLDYPRFSGDLDFTFRGPPSWRRLGTRALSRAVRPTQRLFQRRLSAIAAAQGLSFDAARDVGYGQSNRMMTAAVRYESLLRVPELLKIQIHFTDPLLYPSRRLPARSLLRGRLPSALRLLDSDLPSRYSRPVPVEAYDPREILAEKGGAILTRTAAKTRDVLDLFQLESRLGLRIEDHAEDILRKTRAAVSGVRRYRDQLLATPERFAFLLEEDVGPLLLKAIDERAFQRFRGRAIAFLSELASQVPTRSLK